MLKKEEEEEEERRKKKEEKKRKEEEEKKRKEEEERKKKEEEEKVASPIPDECGIKEVPELDEYGRMLPHAKSHRTNVAVITTYLENNQQYKAKVLTLDGCWSTGRTTRRRRYLRCRCWRRCLRICC